MLLKLVIWKIQGDAHKIPADSEFYRSKGRCFLSILPPTKSKEKLEKRYVVCYKTKFGKNLVIIAKIVKIIQDCALHHALWYATLRLTLSKTIMYNKLEKRYFFPKQFVKVLS